MMIFKPFKKLYTVLRSNVFLLRENAELRNLLHAEMDSTEALRGEVATLKASLSALADERDSLRAESKEAKLNCLVFGSMADNEKTRADKAERTVVLLNRQLEQRITQLYKVGELILNQHPYHKIIEQLRSWTVVVGELPSAEEALPESDLVENEALVVDRLRLLEGSND